MKKKFPWSYGSKISEQLLLDELVGAREVLRGRLLDLGCGIMPYRSILATGVTRWIGVDRNSRANSDFHLDVVGDVCALPFSQSSFDSILCTQVLEHVLHPHVLVAEASRVLRPGGVLVLSVPQYNPLHEEPHDYFRCTLYALGGLADEAGLEIVALRQLGGAIATAGQMIVWHLNWMRRLPAIGEVTSIAVNTMISWISLNLDWASRKYGGGAMKDPLGWLLVARKRAVEMEWRRDGIVGR